MEGPEFDPWSHNKIKYENYEEEEEKSKGNRIGKEKKARQVHSCNLSI